MAEIVGPGQKTAFRRRDNCRGNFHKADFGLRLLGAGLAAPDRVGFLPLLTMELMFSQRADSNRDCAGVMRDEFRELRNSPRTGTN